MKTLKPYLIATLIIYGCFAFVTKIANPLDFTEGGRSGFMILILFSWGLVFFLKRDSII